MLKGWEKIELAQVFQKGEEREGKCHKFILKIKMFRHGFKKNLRQAIQGYYDSMFTEHLLSLEYCML